MGSSLPKPNRVAARGPLPSTVPKPVRAPDRLSAWSASDPLTDQLRSGCGAVGLASGRRSDWPPGRSRQAARSQGQQQAQDRRELSSLPAGRPSTAAGSRRRRYDTEAYLNATR
jgi:hypothetical protein